MKRLKGFKRLVAIAAASMLLCGFTCQAALGSGEETNPKPQEEHKHKHLVVGAECTYTVFLYQHRYLVSTKIYPSGEVEYEYAYCDVVRHFMHDLYRCEECGDQYYGKLYEEDRHMSSHQ